MNKKSGTPGTAVEPTAPAVPHEADVADPGAVEAIKAEQRQTQTGKYGSVKTKPFNGDGASSGGTGGSSDKPSANGQPDNAKKKKVWIEVELLDALGNPVPGQQYEITLSDNSVARGSLNERGLVRLEGVDPGHCKVTFPGYDGRSWKRA